MYGTMGGRKGENVFFTSQFRGEMGRFSKEQEEDKYGTNAVKYKRYLYSTVVLAPNSERYSN